MIINKFLQLFSEEYQKTKSINELIEFTKKTFPLDGTDKIFIGCILIMFEQGITGPSASREYLISIVKSGKEIIGNTNLLNFYVKRINENKMVSKYLKDIDKDEEFDKHLNLILEYLNQFSYDFTRNIKESYNKKIIEFLNNNNK
ncbi:MAG: hypothetical protein NC483_06740 [Ruminococcus sp.]|nr:hypothetical protein [Ruminococcus sp.]